MTLVLVYRLEVVGFCPTTATGLSAYCVFFTFILASPERIWTNVGKSRSVQYRRDSAVVALDITTLKVESSSLSLFNGLTFC